MHFIFWFCIGAGLVVATIPTLLLLILIAIVSK